MGLLTRQKQICKKLIEFSLDAEGQVSAERVELVLKTTASMPRKQRLSILRQYLKLIQQQLRNSRAFVEYAGNLPKASQQHLQNALQTLYGRSLSIVATENPSLIAGVRVRVVDDVYEISIRDRLMRLRQQFKQTA